MRVGGQSRFREILGGLELDGDTVERLRHGMEHGGHPVEHDSDTLQHGGDVLEPVCHELQRGTANLTIQNLPPVVLARSCPYSPLHRNWP